MKLIARIPWGYLIAASKASSTDETRLSICSVRIEPEDWFIRVIATNGRILAALRFKSVNAKKEDPISIPTEVLSRGWFDKDDLVDISVEGEMTSIADGLGQGISFQTFKPEYPKWRQVIPPRDKVRLGFSRSFDPTLLSKLQQACDEINGGKLSMFATGAKNDAIICQSRCDDFFGILMPLRDEWAFDQPTFPQWL